MNSPKTPTTPQKRTGGRSARVRDAVVAAAVDELTHKGIDQFSISSVARAADVHETSIYRRWGSRQGLVAEALHAAHATATPIPDTGSLIADLQQVLISVRDLMQSPMGRAFTMLAVSMQPGQEFYETLKGMWRHRLAALESIFAKAVERGEWDGAIAARPRIDALFGAVNWRVSMTKDDATDAYIAEMVALYCRDGLLIPAAAPAQAKVARRRAA
ncbi:TetR/AcrR family transcriptional regulator [Oxalobacteraceae bacterium OM1]|nr:TetR/AcrR family transcriptional regulator [Oxalobacteraceae bacterium OM1]